LYLLIVGIIVIELIFHPIAGILKMVTKPIQGVNQGVAITTSGIGSFFTSKPALNRANEILEEENQRLQLELERSSLYQDENQALRNLLRVVEERGLYKTIAQVIAHPPATDYDTLLIRLPEGTLLEIGQPVFSGVIFIGMIEELDGDTALVRLVSSDTLTQDVYVGETSILLTGSGGGTFEVTVPKGFPIEEGQVIPHVRFPTQPFARVELIETDDIQAVQRVYLQALFQLHSIRYVNF